MKQKHNPVLLVLLALIVISAMGGMVFAQYVQQTTLNTYVYGRADQVNPVRRSASFTTLRTRRFEDSDDNTFFCEPAGITRLSQLDVREIRFAGANKKLRRNVAGPAYNIDLSNGDAHLWQIRTSGQIRMRAASPPPDCLTTGRAYSGKHVYSNDVAEGIAAPDAQAGDVVIVDPETDLTVRRSWRAFDTAVAGVISTNPTLCLGVTSERKPLALAGIVPCKVTVENGPIAPGDLLVTAHTPGHAMRVDAAALRPGMLVGKALEAWAEGAGSIAILVNKQ